MPLRKSKISRKSKETTIKLELNIDGSGKSKIKTPIGFLDHMLELFTFHGFFLSSGIRVDIIAVVF